MNKQGQAATIRSANKEKKIFHQSHINIEQIFNLSVWLGMWANDKGTCEEFRE